MPIRAMLGTMLVVLTLALAGCAQGNDGATPGTLPNGMNPDGTLPNGLTPEPWGDTS